MELEEKNRFSHREKATEKLVAFLPDNTCKDTLESKSEN